MRVDLPGRLELSCADCAAQFTARLPSLAGRRQLVCPYCAKPLDLYSSLPGQLRRKVYHAIRDALEQRVYHRHRQLYGGLDEWSGEPGDRAGDTPI